MKKIVKMCSGIHISFFWSLLSAVCAQEMPAKAAPMIFTEIETGQVLYETTAPIIFDFKIPDWLNESTLTISNNCTSETESKPCSVLYHIEQIGKQLKSAMFPDTFSLPITTESTWGLKCGVLSKHFSSFKVSPAIVVKYMDFLRYCSKKMILETRRETKYSHSFQRSYEKMLENYNQSYFQQPSSSFSPSNVILTEKELLLAESTFVTTGFVQFLSESQRWKDAFLACKSGLIPDSLVTHELFMQTLTDLNLIVTNEKHKLVIPAEEGFLPFYFKSPIADCTIANGGLLVRILIPVNHIKNEWTHLSVQSIPFRSLQQMNDPDFPDSSDLIGFVKGHEFPKSYFYERSSASLFTADNCDSSQPLFCRLPQKTDSRRLTRKSCVSALIDYENNENGQVLENIFNLCPVVWENEDNINFPILRRKSSNIFYIVSSVVDNISIKCPNEVRDFNSTGYGALEIILPCQCTLVVNEDVYSSELPCGENLSVERIFHPYITNGQASCVGANFSTLIILLLLIAVFSVV